MAIHPKGGGGGKALTGPAIKKKTFFCSFPYLIHLVNSA